MSQLDHDTEDFVRMLYHVADCVRAYKRIISYPDCNTCSKKSSCKYCPKVGEQTRINCPLWKGKAND